MTVDSKRIPEEILLPVAIRYRHKELKSDPEKWTDYEIQRIRADCGSEYAAIPIENIRLQCCGLRKAAKLGTLGPTLNHGATARKDPPPEYEVYLMSTHWKQFRLKILKGWDYRCCWCNSPEKLDVHHRTYERLGKERLNDCVVLCHECHKMADRARQRAKTNKAAMDSLYGNTG